MLKSFELAGELKVSLVFKGLETEGCQAVVEKEEAGCL